MKYIVFFLPLLIFLSPGFGQDFKLEGIVIDSVGGESLAGATVISSAGNTITDNEGGFAIATGEGLLQLRISYVGFRTLTVKLQLQRGITRDTFALSPSSQVLETATVTGSKYERSIARSPVSINVIKPDLIENSNAVRVTSVLNKLPGVQIMDNQAIIRGGTGWSYGAGSRVLLLIDDVPALQGDAGRPLWGDIPVENISQIEVVKGASSVLYGSSAMNGIINVRTGYATAEPVTKAFTSYRHYMDPKDEAKKWWDSAPARFSTGIVHKRKIGKLSLVANGFFEDFDSYYENSFETKYRLSTNLKYKISPRVQFGVNALYNYSEAADPFVWRNGGAGAYKGADNTFSERNSVHYYVDPQISILMPNNDRHKILGRYYYVNNDNNLGQANSSTNTYLEYQYLSSLFGGSTELATGVVGQFIRSDSELFGDVVLNSSNIGSFLQLDHKINENFTITGGLRLEYNEQRSPEVFLGDTIPGGKEQDARLISRVGINYRPAEATYIRASWGEGYRYPTMAEKFIRTFVANFQVYPNVDLEPESGWSSEIGIRQGVKIGGWQGFVDAALFWSQYHNMTEFTARSFDGELGFQSVNVGSTDIKGYEVSLIGQSRIGGVPINLLCGYTRVSPRYEEFVEGSLIYNSITAPVGQEEKINFLKYRSRHNLKADIEAFAGPFSFGLAGIYTSEVVTMDALLSNFAQIGIYREAKPGGYFKLDTRMAYRYDIVKISLLIENLLNEEYTIRPGLLEPPRNISLRLDVEF